MMRHHGGGIGHFQDVRSVDREQDEMVQEESGAGGDGTRPRGDSDVAVESDSMSETDYDTGSGSERGDDGFSEDEESDGYATP
jgi:hypothetical protein